MIKIGEKGYYETPLAREALLSELYYSHLYNDQFLEDSLP